MKNLILGSFLGLLAACSGGSGGGSAASDGSGTLTVEVTDAPLDHELVEQATVWVDLARAHVDPDAAEEEGGWIDLHSGEELTFDLLELTGGLTRTLADARALPAGTYRQLRLRVSRAYLRLVNGNEYSSENGTIHLTSTGKSGFKVFIDPPLKVIDGVDYRLLLDVDLGKTFKPVPANDPLNAAKFNLHPVIRTANLGLAGKLRGTVVDAAGDAVPLATVYLLPEGAEDPEEAVASTGTNEGGFFVILGLVPGVYDALATKDAASGKATSLQIDAGETTETEIVIE